MLDSLRSFASTWMGKLLGAMLLVGLAGFGISGVITGIGSNTVARVGNEDISTREFQRAYQAQINAAAQRTGSVPTGEEALAMGIPSSVINQLASNAALNALGERYGLGVSDERLGKMLREDPAFSGTLGTFDQRTFELVLQQSGYTEREYFNRQTEAARRQQLSASLFGGMTAPAAAVELFSRYANDTRTVDYFTVTPQSIPSVEEPTEEELQAYLEEHQARYRTEPTRNVQLLVLSPEAIEDTIDISDEDVAAEYERTKAGLVRIERRAISQVVLPSEALVDQFEAGLAEGKNFAELVDAAGLQATELGTLSKAQITDKTLADRAFEIEVGEVAFIPGAAGMRAITVTNIEAGGELTLEEARDDIVDGLKERRAKDSYVDILDQIEELRAAFRPMPEIAERYGLDLVELGVTEGGEELAVVSGIPEENRQRVASGIFAADEGGLEPSIALGANLNVWFDLLSVEPARDQTLDEVRGEVRSALVAERTENALVARVEELVSQLDSGVPITDVAGSVGQFPQLSQPFTRSGDGTPVLNASVANQVFNGGADHFGYARNSDGDYVIFQVVGVTPGADDQADQSRDYVANALVNAAYSQFIAALRDDAGVRINQGVLSQVLALDGN